MRWLNGRCRHLAKWQDRHDNELAALPSSTEYSLKSAQGVRRAKAALSSGCEPHPATAPAGSNRSSHGGNEVAEAFDYDVWADPTAISGKAEMAGRVERRVRRLDPDRT